MKSLVKKVWSWWWWRKEEEEEEEESVERCWRSKKLRERMRIQKNEVSVCVCVCAHGRSLHVGGGEIFCFILC